MQNIIPSMKSLPSNSEVKFKQVHKDEIKARRLTHKESENAAHEIFSSGVDIEDEEQKSAQKLI